MPAPDARTLLVSDSGAFVSAPETWEAELRAAGWRVVRPTVWASPEGFLFRGPYGAWCELLRRRAHEVANA